MTAPVMIGRLSRPLEGVGSEVDINTRIRRIKSAFDKLTGDLNMYAPHVFDVMGFGAKGNGLADDTAAISKANTAAAVSGGIVSFNPGTYLVSSDVSISNLVSWVGDGAIIKATSGGTFTRAMVLCGQFIAGGGTFSNGGAGTRYGSVRGLFLDANSIAPIALYVGDCVQRVFENIDCQHALNVGLVVDAAQNCSFVGVNSEKNGDNGANDCHLMLDRGAGNNAFVRCEFSASTAVTNEAKYGVIFRQSASSPTGAFSVPTSNTFLGCVVERAATNQSGAILQMAGRHNTFIRCDLQCPGVRNLVTGTNGDGTSNSLRFVECDFTGTAGQTTAFSLATCTEVTVVGGSFENFTVGFSIDDNSSVELVEPIQMGSVTTRFAATGAKAVTELVVGTRAFTFAGTPTGAPTGMGGTTPLVYDGTNNVLYFYNGAWRGIGLQSGLPNYTFPAAVTVNGTITDEQTAGADQVNVRVRPVGGPSATLVEHVWSMRSNNLDSWFYGYNGTTFKNFVQYDYANHVVHFAPVGTTGADTLKVDLANGVVGVTGNAKLLVAGNGHYVKEGTNATMGSSVLVAGTVTVSTTKVTANSRIFLSNNANGGTVGSLYVSARTAGTSFVITSTNGADTSTVAWLIVEPA